ncbi:hypothetical protein LUZ61_019322 [Rhynchospora tenuis]|uniref:Cysteine-rich receptor-like protein kinase 2 n=1 Tax=Rhynchospora tenuis TaxID=198213 RepID=A0AAD5ZB00_9POAL|nr:hypothetical protein LUZ61_019322 [Rhynchospora tenuis]
MAIPLYLVLSSLLFSLVSCDPQTNLLTVACSQYNATPSSTFLSTLNSTLAELNSTTSISNFSNFATAAQPRAGTPVYALLQCRTYLSITDCMTCFSIAVKELRSCGTASGARAIYDGCMLRYESTSFFDEGTEVGNTGVCSGNADDVDSFQTDVQNMVEDLADAVPKISDYAAAVKMDGLYGYAQCVETVNEIVCKQCLEVAVGNIEGCLRDTGGEQLMLDSGGSSKKYVIIGGVVGGIGFLLLIGTFMWISRSRSIRRNRRGNILGATELQGPVIFPYNDLKTATKNFSEENKLGEGGFGDVYKGLLKNGTVVAVKRLATFETSRARDDFDSEVKLISNVHHRNLVRLLGCSSKGNNLLLVYEYMANSSLDKFLFGEKRGALSWKQRLDIMIGVARGLTYLHQEFHVCIIHRDIKSSNILLDDDFQPKIADFGLARLMPRDLSHLSTQFAGTLGYTAPEYAIQGNLSEKVDVYSYGVVVLEIISGRRSNEVKIEQSTQYLLERAWALYETDELMALVDESLNPEEYDEEEVKRIIKIALMCTQSTVAARPTMSGVFVLLTNRSGSLPEPTRPTFIDPTFRVRGEVSSAGSSASASKATISISQFSAR